MPISSTSSPRHWVFASVIMSRPCSIQACPALIPNWDPHPGCFSHRECNETFKCQPHCAALSHEQFVIIEQAYLIRVFDQGLLDLAWETGTGGEVSPVRRPGHPRPATLIRRQVGRLLPRRLLRKHGRYRSRDDIAIFFFFTSQRRYC